jgi:hypothetical protein
MHEKLKTRSEETILETQAWMWGSHLLIRTAEECGICKEVNWTYVTWLGSSCGLLLRRCWTFGLYKDEAFVNHMRDTSSPLSKVTIALESTVEAFFVTGTSFRTNPCEREHYCIFSLLAHLILLFGPTLILLESVTSEMHFVGYTRSTNCTS